MTNDWQVDLRIPRGIQEVCQIFKVDNPAEFFSMPEALQRRIMILLRQAAPGIDMASMMKRRMFTMTNAAMYGLSKTPRQAKGKGKGKGILPIMDDRRRANL